MMFNGIRVIVQTIRTAIMMFILMAAPIAAMIYFSAPDITSGQAVKEWQELLTYSNQAVTSAWAFVSELVSK